MEDELFDLRKEHATPHVLKSYHDEIVQQLQQELQTCRQEKQNFLDKSNQLTTQIELMERQTEKSKVHARSLKALYTSKLKAKQQALQDEIKRSEDQLAEYKNSEKKRINNINKQIAALQGIITEESKAALQREVVRQGPVVVVESPRIKENKAKIAQLTTENTELHTKLSKQQQEIKTLQTKLKTRQQGISVNRTVELEAKLKQVRATKDAKIQHLDNVAHKLKYVAQKHKLDNENAQKEISRLRDIIRKHRKKGSHRETAQSDFLAYNDSPQDVIKTITPSDQKSRPSLLNSAGSRPFEDKMKEVRPLTGGNEQLGDRVIMAGESVTNFNLKKKRPMTAYTGHTGSRGQSQMTESQIRIRGSKRPGQHVAMAGPDHLPARKVHPALRSYLSPHLNL